MAQFQTVFCSTYFKIGQNCRSTCSKTPNCTHYNWSPEEEGLCWLKEGKVDAGSAVLAAEKAECGIMPTPIPKSDERGIQWMQSIAGVWAEGCQYVDEEFERDNQVNTFDVHAVEAALLCYHFILMLSFGLCDRIDKVQITLNTKSYHLDSSQK